MPLTPYLFFNGRCEEALNFYKTALGAEVSMLMRYCDSPQPAAPGQLPPGSENKIMHSHLRIGDIELMASDGHCNGTTEFKGFALSLALADEGAARRAFEALTPAGCINMPMGKTFWSPCFGMVTDRFGIQWMITVPMAQ